MCFNYRNKQITVSAETFDSTHSKLREECGHYRKLLSKLFACQNCERPKSGFLQGRVLGKLFGGVLPPALANNSNAQRVNGCAAVMCYLLYSKLGGGGKETQEQGLVPVAKSAWYLQ